MPTRRPTTRAALGAQNPPTALAPPATPPAPPPGDPFTPFLDPTKTGASYIDPRTGRAVEGGATPPTGTPYYASAPLVNGGLGTASGDRNNAFRGYVSSDGGGFGNGGATGAAAFRMNAGVDPSRLGDTSSWTPAQWQQNNDLFGKIANNDPASILAARQSTNPFIKETGDHYASTAANQYAIGQYQNAHGQQNEFAAATDHPYDPNAANDYAATHMPDQGDTDPYGRLDSASGPARHGIITPAREAQMGAQADELRQPLLQDPNAPQGAQAATPPMGTLSNPGITRIPLPPLSGDPMLPPNGGDNFRRLGPQDIPPQGGDPSVPPTGITGIGPRTPPSTAPVGGWPQFPQIPNGIGPNSPGFQTPPSGQPPVPPTPVDPFQAFNPANPIPPVTPATPFAGSARPSTLAAY